MEELIQRFRLHTVKFFTKHGIMPVIFSRGDESNHNSFSYVVSFPDKLSQTKGWNSFMNDQERIGIWDESNKNGKLVTSIESRSFQALDIE